MFLRHSECRKVRYRVVHQDGQGAEGPRQLYVAQQTQAEDDAPDQYHGSCGSVSLIVQANKQHREVPSPSHCIALVAVVAFVAMERFKIGLITSTIACAILRLAWRTWN